MRIDLPRWAVSLLVAALVIVVVPGAALAAGGHADAGHDPADKAAFIDIKRYDLGIYTLIVFGLLFFILSKFAWGPFTDGLRHREASIVAARDQAQQALKEAEDLRAQLKQDLQKAQDQVRAMLEEARRDADVLRQKEKEAGVKDARDERERARREIEAAKDAALKEISERAIDLAALMSTKALQRQITPDDHRRLLDESLAELAHTARPSA